ncbi:hypothetical protein [Caballeronia sp. AZ7_KS35]|uniref:hypothetical protein n=1 Tax=Caballeronia sp. AZ7_KS35 TaxID=2921762 RepID=UPI002029794E|nr:hypothetical protein [Caballeronia sp. AZ7_KS35]
MNHQKLSAIAAIRRYLVSTAIFAAGAWAKASSYNLEPPLVALALGLIDRLTMPRVPRVQCIAEKLRC